jgi:hypothetical protein
MRLTIKQVLVLVSLVALVAAGGTYAASKRSSRVVYLRPNDTVRMDWWSAKCSTGIGVTGYGSIFCWKHDATGERVGYAVTLFRNAVTVYFYPRAGYAPKIVFERTH